MNRDIPRTNGNGAGFLTAGVLRRALAPRSSARSGPLSPLQLLGLVTALYLAASTLFLTLIGGDVPGLIVSGIASSAVFFTMIEQMMPLWVLPLVVALMAGVVLAAPGLRAHARTRSSEVLAAIILSALFVNAFSMVKTHLPAVIPFWADPMFTRIDTALGLTGSFTWLSDISTLLLLKIYMNGWVFVATFLPAILAAFDADAARRRRFILLWAAAWVVLGNLLAGAFMSAGPIFLDRLDGGTPEAFPTLFALLARPDAAELNAISDFLWTNYSTGQFSVGSGISAFPSVHVGMAVVFGLYIFERLTEAARAQAGSMISHVVCHIAWAGPTLMVAVYLVLSVHLGWHYLSDGVASILVIWGLHALLRRRMQAKG